MQQKGSFRQEQIGIQNILSAGDAAYRPGVHTAGKVWYAGDMIAPVLPVHWVWLHLYCPCTWYDCTCIACALGVIAPVLPVHWVW